MTKIEDRLVGGRDGVKRKVSVAIRRWHRRSVLMMEQLCILTLVVVTTTHVIKLHRTLYPFAYTCRDKCM